MKSTNAEDRTKRDEVINQFCTPARGLLYEPENEYPQFDAVLYLEGKDRFTGLAKIVPQAGNYGSKPVVEVKKESVDWLYEVATLTGKAAALIFKFRNKLMYWRIKDVEKIPFENDLKRGKSHTVYKIPINLLVNL